MPKQFTDRDTALISVRHLWVGFDKSGKHDLASVGTIYHRPLLRQYQEPLPRCSAHTVGVLFYLVHLEVASKVARPCKRCYP